MVKTLLMVAFIIISVILTVIILFQEGKQAGLGSLGGQSIDNSYWSKNKGRSREGMLVRVTAALVVLFFVLASVLCIGSL